MALADCFGLEFSCGLDPVGTGPHGLGTIGFLGFDRGRLQCLVNVGDLGFHQRSISIDRNTVKPYATGTVARKPAACPGSAR